MQLAGLSLYLVVSACSVVSVGTITGTSGDDSIKLTTRFIQSITRPGRYYDDAAPGLFVLAQERKDRIRLSFVQRLTVHGKRVDIGLGSPRWGATTLSEARARAMSNYRIARNGGDPRAAKRQVPAFADGIEAVLAIQREAWRDGGKSEKQWRSSLATYARSLMDKPLDAIGPGDVLAVLVPIWSAKRETAQRVKQRIGAIMKWAIAEGHRESNPVDAIGAALPKNANHRTHFKALPYERVGSALATVRASAAWWATKAALEFLVLSAARSGEVRGMVWSEVDLDARTWTVPASRMKANRVHVVPLSESSARGARRGARTRRRLGARVPVRHRPGDERFHPEQVGQGARYRGHAARNALGVPRLGSGVHELPARGRRGSARTRQPESCRSRLSPVDPRSEAAGVVAALERLSEPGQRRNGR